jgi:hypothetical protein
MSWDIFVQDLPAGISSVADIPDSFKPGPIGQRSEIMAKLSALYPESNFTDPSWGTLELPGCSIEFNLGSGDKLQSFAMHVRGDERAPVVIGDIIAGLGVRALDPSSASGLFESDPILRSESFTRWKSCRSQVLADRDRPGQRGN